MNHDNWESDGILNRYKHNPILEAIKEHPWEAKMIYNPATVRIDGVIYIIYRAIGHDHISRLGLAWTINGVDIIGRFPFPIFEPSEDYEIPSEEDAAARPREKGGCEDPRITLIGDTLYMVYTAYGKLCQIAIASIRIKEFKALVAAAAFGKDTCWNEVWIRHGIVFPENTEKEIFSRNACVFPVTVGGKMVKYALIYRWSTSNVMITYSDSPIGPWGAGSVFIRPTFSWEEDRVGICSPPIQTDNGLLFIYHGVAVEASKEKVRTYRLGALYANFDIDEGGEIRVNVSKVKTPILSPQRAYEEQSDWLEPLNLRAVFCCGTVPRTDKEMVEADDEIFVYYGAGDVRTCVGIIKNSQLKSLL